MVCFFTDRKKHISDRQHEFTWSWVLFGACELNFFYHKYWQFNPEWYTPIIYEKVKQLDSGSYYKQLNLTLQNGKSWVQHRTLLFACVELAAWAFIIPHLILIRPRKDNYNHAYFRNEKMDYERLKYPRPCSQNKSRRRCV